jgi:Tol biopolymer transport system component
LNLWRVNADGTGLTQLTDLAMATDPQCSPDGKWVIFSALENGSSWSAWRVPLEGGQAERCVDGYARSAIISPDGQFLAYLVAEGQETITKIIVRPYAGGAPIKTLVLPSTYYSSLTWTPDGKGFTFSDNRSGNSEIYYQALSGGEPRKLTDFNSQRIFSLAWSPDGKQLAFSRGQRTSDVVRISNFK